LYRFSAFTVMFITLIVGLSYPNPFANHNSTAVVPTPHIAQVSVDTPQFVVASNSSHIAFSKLADWNGFAELFTTSAVALNFHFCVPDIVQPLRDKTKVREVTSAALLTATSFYLTLGVLASIYFGESTTPLVTLNWQHYSGFHGGWAGDYTKRAWWATAIQVWVMFFPVLDMISIFPLVGISLGNSVQSFVPLTVKLSPKVVMVLCRLAVTVPPILLAAGLKAIDQIFSFAGLSAIFLQFVFPAALQWASIVLCEKRWGVESWWTSYTMKISGKPWAILAIVFGAVSFVFSIVIWIKNLVEDKL